MNIVNNLKCEIEGMANSKSVWNIWSDFIYMSAAAIANACDPTQYDVREEKYMDIVKTYNKDELDKFVKMLAMVVASLEKNPDQDILGEVCSVLKMTELEKAQYFTPYNVSKLMASIVHADRGCDEGKVQIFNEPCCGGGSMIIAYANSLRNSGINYQKQVYFVAQDISLVAAQMCFIQLSLLGCPGVVIVGDTLKGDTMDMEKWYTPMHFIYGEYILHRHKKQKLEEMAQLTEESPKEVYTTENNWLLQMVGIL